MQSAVLAPCPIQVLLSARPQALKIDTISFSCIWSYRIRFEGMERNFLVGFWLF